MRKQRIYLIGASGCPNYGDDRIALEWIKFYQAHDADVVLESLNNDLMLQCLKIIGMQCATAENIWSNSSKIVFHSAEEAYEFGRSYFDRISASELMNVDVIHLHGGGYLNSLWHRPAAGLGFAVACKERFGVKLVATGLGLGPLGDDEGKVFVKAFSNFDFVEVRDQYSFDKIKTCVGAIGGYDDYFLNPKLSNEPQRIRRLHLNFQSQWELERPESLATKVSTFISLNGDLFDEIVYYDFCPLGDAEFLKVLQYTADREIKYHTYWNLIESHMEGGLQDIAFVSRFHAHLMLSCLGVVGSYVSVQPAYYDLKHNSVVEIGSGWNPLDMKQDKITKPKGKNEIDFTKIINAKNTLARSILM